jgi:hypothetical protein
MFVALVEGASVSRIGKNAASGMPVVRSGVTVTSARRSESPKMK